MTDRGTGTPQRAFDLARETHLAQEGVPPRIGVQRAQTRTGLRFWEPAIALHVRPLQPVEGEVRLAARAIHLRDLEGAVGLVFRDQFLQCRVGFIAAARGVLDDRERLETKCLIRLARRLGPRLVATALREQVQRQKGVRGCLLRGEL